jgi:hypothetical protein
MKSIKILGFAAFFAIAAIASTAFINGKLLTKVNKTTADNKGFAVVELYTSEGCSSCPPADELVAKIEKESSGKPVYILAYHVDYWNRLGWKDQFSSADFSKRQNDYATYLNLSSVYTPQVIVNGKTEFVGSQEGTLRNAIKAGLQKTTTALVELNIAGISQNQATLKYNAEGTDKYTVLQVAILQKQAVSKVERGENSGRTLSHVQIVHKLQTVALSANSGTVSVSLPHSFDAQSWEIIAFLQNTANGSITGAARATMPGVSIAQSK